MKYPKVPAWLELPLLRRELIENAHKKRTYVVRILVALIFMLVMLLFYSEQIGRHTSVLQVMGRGRELAAILLVCNLVAIYVLLPTMACSAISSEREKQTLSLILITRITPGGLIAEKFLSRLVPMIALMLITLPMLSIAYMLGGLRLEAVFAALLGLFTAAVQVNSAAIMCSALFRTALEAFWATYLLFAIMGLGPPLLNELGFLPHNNWFPTFGSDAVAAVFVLFLAVSVAAIEGYSSMGAMILSTLPPLTAAAAMLVVSRFAIAHGQQEAPFSFQTFAKLGHRAGSLLYQIATIPFRILTRMLTGNSLTSFQWLADDIRPPRPFPLTQPVAWRERQISALSGWRLHAALLFALVVFEWGWLVAEGHYGRHHREEICIIVDVLLFIFSLLLLIGVTCRMFSSERERQTLDLLLTTPLTNRELLREKLSAANRTTLFLLVPILVAAITHLLCGRIHVPQNGFNNNYYPGMMEVFMGELTWWHVAFRYLIGLISHALLYLTLAKWIAVWFSLSLNSQMKAMLGTILTIIALCVIPAMLCAIPMLWVGSNPDQAGLQIWYLTSPVFVFAFNETNDFFVLLHSSWWPRSEYFTLFANLAIYGLLTLTVRTVVIVSLPLLLNRRDSHDSSGRPMQAAHNCSVTV